MRPDIRELFRNTVTVADEDPPGMEFRVMRQIDWQAEPTVCYTTESKPLALMERRKIELYHEAYYAKFRVWVEQRTVSEWREIE